MGDVLRLHHSAHRLSLTSRAERPSGRQGDVASIELIVMSLNRNEFELLGTSALDVVDQEGVALRGIRRRQLMLARRKVVYWVEGVHDAGSREELRLWIAVLDVAVAKGAIGAAVCSEAKRTRGDLRAGSRALDVVRGEEGGFAAAELLLVKVFLGGFGLGTVDVADLSDVVDVALRATYGREGSFGIGKCPIDWITLHTSVIGVVVDGDVVDELRKRHSVFIFPFSFRFRKKC